MDDYLWRLEKNRPPHAIEKFGCPKVSVQTTVSEGKSLTTLLMTYTTLLLCMRSSPPSRAEIDNSNRPAAHRAINHHLCYVIASSDTDQTLT